MRRRLIALSSVVLLLVTLVAAQAVVLAQGEPNSVRISTRTLGGGPPSAAGKWFGLIRLTFWPGATLGERSDAGASVLYVESGRLGYRLIEGHAWITRTPSGFGPGLSASQREQLMPGDVFLGAGDSLFSEADVVYAAWNAGDAPALVTIATLVRPDQPVPPSI
jgi:hypothetical protein